MNTYKPNEFAEMIGVSVKTLQRWDNDGKLKAYRNPSDRRYYTHHQYVEYMANLNGCEIEIIDSTEKTEEQELVEDLVQIITVFSCKLQGKRANKARKIINELTEKGGEGE